MPRAGDAFLNGALPVTHDPLARIDVRKDKPTFDLAAILAQIEQFVEDFLFPAIKSLTGIDLSSIADLIGGLGIEDIIDRIQVLIDTLFKAFGGSGIENTIEDLLQILHLIPQDNMPGSTGGATVRDDLFGIIDAFISGFVGKPGATGGGRADATAVAGQVASNAYLGGEAWLKATMLNNTPVARGMLATGRANYDLTSANTFLATTQAAGLSSSFGLLQDMPIGVISWYGYGSSGITAFYVNIRKVNPTTGVRNLVHHSANIVANLQPGTTAANGNWMFYELPSPLAGLATDNYFVEFVPVGGTHYIRGMSFSDSIKDHPVAAVPCVATTVDYSSNPNTPAASLAKATAGPNVPWVEFAVSLGSVADHHEPVRQTLGFDGESIPIPSWANRVDLVPLGRGGNGANGATLGLAGNPGQPGKFAPITIVRGTDFSGAATFITLSTPPDGSATLSIPGRSTTAAPGANGSGVTLSPIGRGPGVLSYNGQDYVGGVDQRAAGEDGGSPGGGGAGGNGIFFQQGGKGGKPVGFVTFRQVPVDNEIPADTTPPVVGALTVTGTGLSSVTVTGAVATD